MRKKLEKFESYLRGDNNPRWTVVYELLKEIVDKLEPKEEETKCEDTKTTKDRIDELSELINKKSDYLFKEATELFDKFKKKFNEWK